MAIEEGADADLEPSEELIEADVEVTEPEAELEGEDGSPPSDEENVEEKTEEDNSFAKRIDKLTENWRTTERALTAMEVENFQLRKRIEEIPTPEPEIKTLADFNYDERAYQTHLFGEARRIAREEAASLREQDSTTSSLDEEIRSYRERETEFSKDVPDYRVKVYDKDLRISDAMVEIIRNSDLGPQLAYVLANEPAEARRISRLSPAMAGMELAIKLSGIKAEKGKVKKLVSDAPSPPNKIRGVDAGIKVSTTDPRSDKMSDEQWYKAEELRLAKLR